MGKGKKSKQKQLGEEKRKKREMNSARDCPAPTLKRRTKGKKKKKNNKRHMEGGHIQGLAAEETVSSRRESGKRKTIAKCQANKRQNAR